MSPNNPEMTGVEREEMAGADDLPASVLDERGGQPTKVEVKVTDRRRGLAEADAEFEADEAAEPSLEPEPDEELAEMRVKLQESEERRLAAERSAEELADRFRKAQVHLRAENDEVRARLQRTFDQRLETARGDLVSSLLDTLDNLQRALSAADAGGEQNYEALRGGVQATAEMFEAQLKRLGLTKVASEGELFNPEIHEAVEMAIVPPSEDSRVLAELRPGYRFGERLLRPTQVRVGRGSES